MHPTKLIACRSCHGRKWLCRAMGFTQLRLVQGRPVSKGDSRFEAETTTIFMAQPHPPCIMFASTQNANGQRTPPIHLKSQERIAGSKTHLGPMRDPCQRSDLNRMTRTRGEPASFSGMALHLTKAVRFLLTKSSHQVRRLHARFPKSSK